MKNKPISILSLFTVFSILLVFIISCQKTQSYIPVYYNITNNTDSKIIVYYNAAIGHYTNPYDSIINIQSGNKTTLLVSLNYQYYNPGNPEKEDTLTVITSLKIYNNDSIESIKNFHLTKYWNYSEMSSKSDLDLYVNPNDF